MMVLEIWSMYIVVQTAALVVVNEFHLCCIKCGPKGFPSLAALNERNMQIVIFCEEHILSDSMFTLYCKLVIKLTKQQMW